MLKEMLGIRTGILSDLHEDHQEVAALMERILASEDGKERTQLFREMSSKLAAHAKAEEKVLYKKMQKSGEEDIRKFGFEGGVEHEVIEAQLAELGRARNKATEPWTARMTVLQEVVTHHVAEEEGDGFSDARKEFSSEQLEKLGEQFRREKERMLAEA